MSNVIKEINSGELNRLIFSLNACKANNTGCILEPRFGKVIFDLSEFKGLESCKLYAKRISGNGKAVVKCGDTDTNINVLSKISQCFVLDVKSSRIEIYRPTDSTGEVCVFGMTVGLNHAQEETVLGNNWKALISKCGKYNCLRMVDNRLFASEGAYLENAAVVKSIETVPPNMTVRSGEKLKFLGSCEIISLVIDENATSVRDNQPYIHRQDFFPQLSASNNDSTSDLIIKNTSIPNLIPNVIPKAITEQNHINIVFDSNSHGTFKSYNNGKLVKFINSNGKSYLLLRKTGLFSIPISTLNPNKSYVIIVNLKKINGNGRINVGFGLGNSLPSSYASLIAEAHESDKYVEISTANIEYPGEHFKLFISMLDDGVGEVLISRVIVVENLPKSLAKTNEVTIDNITFINENFKFDFVQSSGLISSRKRFVIVIPSYNNVKWCEKNIISTIDQNYENYRVIYTDDCSADGTFDRVKEIVAASSKKDRFTLIRNEHRLGALENLYNMIHSCDDDEIVLTLDGDDWLASENVLNRLNEVYSSGEVWMTYGQYQNYPDGGRGVAQLIPSNVVRDSSFRQYQWCATHLRTFYSWLFKNINKNDLYYNGNFMSMTWDMAMMFPMLEMSGPRSRFINDIMYIYNMDNPINDHKVNIKLQQDLDRYVRRLSRYKKLDRPIVRKNSVGLMLIATGKYHEYIQGIISSADNYFLKGLDVTYYLFSEVEHKLRSDRTIIHLPIEHRPFPFASMDRFKHFTKHADRLAREKYLYYVDVDCLFVDHVSTEIIGSLVGVCHCGYLNKGGPVEENQQSAFYVNPQQYKYYFGGGFSGGRSDKYLELAKWCSDMIDRDVNNGIIPIWHDETAINRYFLDHEPDIILSPSYHYPQGNINHYRSIWNRSFDPKIMLLDKNHGDMRK